MMFAAIGQPKDEAISRSLFHGFCEHLPTGRKETWPMNKFIGFPVSIAPPLLTRMKWGCDRRDYRLMGDVLNCNLPRHLWSSQWEADRDSFIVHKCDAQPFYFADLRRSQGQIIVCDDLQALCNVLCDIHLFPQSLIVPMPMDHLWLFRVWPTSSIEIVKLKVVSPDGPSPSMFIPYIPVAQRV